MAQWHFNRQGFNRQGSSQRTLNPQTLNPQTLNSPVQNQRERSRRRRTAFPWWNGLSIPPWRSPSGWLNRLGLICLGLATCLGLVACSAFGPNDSVSLTLVSYGVTQAAYKDIIPKFEAKWKAEHHQTVFIDQSYGGSGAQTRAVIDGLDADVVALALPLDVKKIEKVGLIAPGWEQEFPNNSIVHSSVAALVTRSGNPKQIQGWADLVTDDTQVITANPKTSGGARWNFLALWGSTIQAGGDEAQALNFATQVFQHTPVLPRDAREATDVFVNQEQGDVLINYENEVLLAQQRGEELSYVVPSVNISIDSPVAIVDANVDKHGTRDIAEAFVQFLFTPESQAAFAQVGFRPVDPTVFETYATQFPKVDTLFTVQDLGGWDTVQEKFFADGAIFDQIQASIGR